MAEDAFINENQGYFQRLLLNNSNEQGSDIEEENEEEEEEETVQAAVRDWQGELIEEIRKYPCIWNTKCKAHKDKFKKAEAWRRIAFVFNRDGKIFILFDVSSLN